MISEGNLVLKLRIFILKLKIFDNFELNFKKSFKFKDGHEISGGGP